MNKLLFVVTLATFLQPHSTKSMEIVIQKGSISRNALNGKVKQLQELFQQNPEADWGDAPGKAGDKKAMSALCFNHALAHMKNTAFIKAFIQRGVEVNTSLRFEGQRVGTVSPLGVAVMARGEEYITSENYLVNIELLLAKGATFSDDARRVDLARCIDRICYRQIDIFDCAEKIAFEKRFIPTLSKLIALGCPVRGVQSFEPPLRAAKEMPLVVAVLLQHGANPLARYMGSSILAHAQGRADLNCFDIQSPQDEYANKVQKEVVALLEANAAQREATLAALPLLGKDTQLYLAKLPLDLKNLVVNYFQG